jgi:hypothetical protein
MPKSYISRNENIHVNEIKQYRDQQKRFISGEKIIPPSDYEIQDCRDYEYLNCYWNFQKIGE